MYQNGQQMYGMPNMGGQPMYGGFPQQNQNGFAYGARPAPHATQPVTPDLQKMLHQNNDELDIRISNVDKIRNWCTHKEYGTGRMALVPTGNKDEEGNAEVTCRVCGATFYLINDIVAKSKKVSEDCINIIQTAKAQFMDAPEDFIKSYSQLISMLGLLPKIAAKASKNFGLYENYTGNIYQSNPGVNAFQAFNSIVSGYPMNYPQQAPMGYGMPQAGFGMPQAPMGYGMPQHGYGMPPQGYPQQAPMNNGAIPMGGQVMPQAPQIDANGNVIPNYGMPNAPTTMNGMPMQPNFNPLVNQPTVNPAPAPTGPAQPQVTTTPVTAPAGDPQQTKTMTV